MKIIFMGNNYPAFKILSYLLEQDENIILGVIHPPDKAKYFDEIKSILESKQIKYIFADTLKDTDKIELIKSLEPDLILSISFGYILKTDIISIPKKGIINLHKSFLPYDRGASPNIWSIVEENPAGVSLHYIDEEIDEGPLLFRKELQILPEDTGKTLNERLESEAVEFFKEKWPLIKKGDLPAVEIKEDGCHHFDKDVNKIDLIKLDGSYKAKDLINIMRARTFPPYKGSYFVKGGKKYYVEIKITPEDEME